MILFIPDWKLYAWKKTTLKIKNHNRYAIQCKKKQKSLYGLNPNIVNLWSNMHSTFLEQEKFKRNLK